MDTSQLWERISSDGQAGQIKTDRLAVPGGWLYRVIIRSITGPGVAVTTQFIDDETAYELNKQRLDRIAAAEKTNAAMRLAAR